MHSPPALSIAQVVIPHSLRKNSWEKGLEQNSIPAAARARVRQAANPATWTARMWSPGCASLAMTHANISREHDVDFIPTTSFLPCRCRRRPLPPPPSPPPPCCCFLPLLVPTTTAGPSSRRSSWTTPPPPTSNSPISHASSRSLSPRTTWKHQLHVMRKQASKRASSSTLTTSPGNYKPQHRLIWWSSSSNDNDHKKLPKTWCKINAIIGHRCSLIAAMAIQASHCSKSLIHLSRCSMDLRNNGPPSSSSRRSRRTRTPQAAPLSLGRSVAGKSGQDPWAEKKKKNRTWQTRL